MHKLVGNTIKATIIQLIVALFITALILLSVYLLFGAKIEGTISLISKVSMDVDSEAKQVETVMTEDNKIKNYH